MSDGPIVPVNFQESAISGQSLNTIVLFYRLPAWLVCALSLILIGCEDPPLSSQQRARAALERAAVAQALTYAESDYRRAEELLKDGQMEIARQNGRLAPFRSYRVADSLLAQAFMQATKAADSAQISVRNLRALATREYETLREDLQTWREALDGSLTIFHAERYWTAADLAVSTSEQLLLRREYEAALQSITRGKEFLHLVSKILTDYTNDEAQKIKIWRRWVDETVERSKTGGSSAIIVDKVAHTLYLVRAGKIFHRYPCDLGFNSARQKFFSGDGATPEGKYCITRYRPNGSGYYKALMLNYPNEQDEQRFAENKKKGLISKRARIGSLIEIHGEGGRNEDWTNGCVALSNKEMDHLMQYVAEGTPVTIVRRAENWP